MKSLKLNFVLALVIISVLGALHVMADTGVERKDTTSDGNANNDDLLACLENCVSAYDACIEGAKKSFSVYTKAFSGGVGKNIRDSNATKLDLAMTKMMEAMAECSDELSACQSGCDGGTEK